MKSNLPRDTSCHNPSLFHDGVCKEDAIFVVNHSGCEKRSMNAREMGLATPFEKNLRVTTDSRNINESIGLVIVLSIGVNVGTFLMTNELTTTISNLVGSVRYSYSHVACVIV